MSRIVNRLAGVLPHFCLFLAIAAPLSLILIIAMVPAEKLTLAMNISERAHALPHLGWERRVLATLICLLPVGCLSYGLMHARSSLRRFNSGEYFSASAIRGIRSFGAGIFWSSLLTLAVAPLAMYTLTRYSEGTHTGRTLMFRLDVSTLVLLAIGGIIWQIASMMQRAAELAEENRQFV
jgi:uncharacterized membrane protein YidH (DUF202 family)